MCVCVSICTCIYMLVHAIFTVHMHGVTDSKWEK